MHSETSPKSNRQSIDQLAIHLKKHSEVEEVIQLESLEPDQMSVLDYPDSPFQCFVKDQCERHGMTDNTTLRRLWLEMDNDARMKYKTDLVIQRGTEQVAAGKLGTEPRQTRFSRFALNNIIAMDAELKNKVQKEAFEYVLLAIDVFATDLITESDKERKKTTNKKKALKADNLYRHVSQFNFKYWFCKELRLEYEAAKRVIKETKMVKRENEAAKSIGKDKTNETATELKKITDYFGNTAIKA